MHLIVRSLLLIVAAAAALLSSCAKVTFHTDSTLKRKTGLKFYTSKPYLLVSFTGSKDNPIKIETINLPDLKNPTYAVYHTGWGSHVFNVGVNPNGTLSTYGQTADSKGPETLTALGNLLSSAGSGFSNFATGLGTLGKQSAAHDAATQAVRDANAILSNIANKSPADIQPFTSLQAVAITTVQTLGKVAAAIPANPKGQIAPLEGAKAALNAAQVPDSASSDKAAALKSDVARAMALIGSAIDTLKKADAEPVAKPDFKLYEFIIENDTTVLREVSTAAALKILPPPFNGK